jgi:hypothetical protein
MTKSLFRSKTLAVQAVTLAAAFYPPISATVATHPTETLIILGLVNTALRFLTKNKVVLFV